MKTHLEKLSDKATGGTWYGIESMVETDNEYGADPACCRTESYGHTSTPEAERANAEFIAAVVNAFRDGRLIETGVAI
jgi:hypothetical protein